MSKPWSKLRALATTIIAIGLSGVAAANAAEKTVVIDKLQNPESVVIGDDGRAYVSVQGRSNADGDGQVVVIVDGAAKPFAKGLNDPKGLDKRGKEFFVADKTKVWHINAAGDATVYVDADKFPVPPRFLNDLTVGPNGDVFVSDTTGGAVFRITPAKEVTAVVDGKSSPAIRGPNGLLPDGADHLLVLDFNAGKLFRVSLADRTVTELAANLGSPDGLARDAAGRFYISDYRGGRILKFEKTLGEPTILAEGLQAPADICLDNTGRLLIPEARAGNLTAVPLFPGS